MPDDHQDQHTSALSALTSKVKDLYLQLLDYSYFHSPSGLEKQDERFVGRKKIMDKLEGILTNSETRSGAYLVTGYRGVGKTSLVRKVLARVRAHPVPGWPMVLTTALVFALTLTIFSKDLLFWSSLIYILLFQVMRMVIKSVQLIQYSNEYAGRRKQFWSGDWGSPVVIAAWRTIRDAVTHNIWHNLDLLRGYSRKSNWNIVWRLLFICALMHLVHQQVVGRWLPGDPALAGWIVPIIYGGFLLVRLGIRKGEKQWKQLLARQKNRGRPIHRWRLLVRVGDSLYKRTVSRFNFRQSIPIELSLAQHDLEDRDILQLIARSLYKKYKLTLSPFFSFRRLAWWLGLNGLVYLLLSFVFFNKDIYRLTHEVKNNSWVTAYFPSQSALSPIGAELPSWSDTTDSVQPLDVFLRRGGITQMEWEWAGSLQKFSVRMDYWLSNGYEQLMGTRVGKAGTGPFLPRFFAKGLGLIEHYRIVPAHLDYLFLIFLLFGYTGMAILKRLLPVWGIETHRSLLAQLRQLNDRIDSVVVAEQGRELGSLRSGWPFRIFGRRSRNYPIAGAREIETELIHIFRALDRIPAVALRPQFIFILDELDKVEVMEAQSGNEDEEEPVFGPEYTRRKQEAIATLLGNLKHFLNVAKAKFIFIASREMYDVSLSDISDRDAYLGSVFHDVIHVPSFYTDSYSHDAADITRLTEEYVCQFLVPAGYEQTLEGYHEYLVKEENRMFAPSANDPNLRKAEIRWQRRKAIYTLQQFIVYLTYRSNGKPKNLTRLMEEQLAKSVPERTLAKAHVIRKDPGPGCFYLHFDELQQYKFGFTTYIFAQFLVTKSRYMREYGDKLLVSSSYLIDHLYKFHNFAFSWQNLEVTPEIIDINKAPELRTFVRGLVQTVSNIHLREIVSGLHQFKFYKKITHEISFISKVSEIEAAAFNFTLDEHLQTKRHFQIRLKQLKAGATEIIRASGQSEHLYAIGAVNMTLGDLHYFDQEYEEAKLQYREALQALEGHQSKDLDMKRFLLTVRNMLKLGLAHERTGNYDSAVAVYGNLSIKVFAFRDLEFQHFGLVKAILPRHELVPFILERYEDLQRNTRLNKILRDFEEGEGTQGADWRSLLASREEALLDSRLKWVTQSRKKMMEEDGPKDAKENCLRYVGLFIRLFGHRNEQIIYGRPKPHSRSKHQEGDYWNWRDIGNFHALSVHMLTQLRTLPFSSEKETYYLKRTIMEGQRLIYQPMMAKLEAIEKSTLGGISVADLKRVEKEFEYLWWAVLETEKPLIQSEFYNKVGHILYFKNGYLMGTYDDQPVKLNQDCQKELKEDATRLDEEQNDKQEKGPVRIRLSEMRQRFCIKTENRDFKAPLHAYKFYIRGLLILKNRFSLYHTKTFEYYKIDNDPYGELPGIFRAFMISIQAEVPKLAIDVDNRGKEPHEQTLQLQYPSMRNTTVEAIGNLFSDLGDALLAMIPERAGEEGGQNRIRLDFFSLLLGGLEKKDEKTKVKSEFKWVIKKEERLTKLIEWATQWENKKPDHSPPTRLEMVLLSYCMASMYFLRAGLHRKYAFQNLKILYVFRDYLHGFSSDDQALGVFQSERFWRWIRYGLVHRVLRAVHRSHQGASHIEVERYFFRMIHELGDDYHKGEALNLEPYSMEVADQGHPDARLRESIRNHLSTNPEIREVVVLYLDVGMYVNKKRLPFRFPNEMMINAYSGISSQFLRVQELKLKAHVYKRLYDLLTKDPLEKWTDPNTPLKDFYGLERWPWPKTHLPGDTPLRQARLHLICDIIYCYWESIRSYKIFGVSYMTTHSVIGFAYYALGKYCFAYQNMLREIAREEGGPETTREINREMSTRLGVEARTLINPAYHFEQAIFHFYSARQTHNEGDAYQRNLQNMYFLEDDFSDKMFHFGAAIERYKINTEAIARMIKKSRKYLEKLGTVHDLYDIEGYAGTYPKNGSEVGPFKLL